MFASGKPAGGLMFACPKGISELLGTGFETQMTATGQGSAATGWIETSAPVPPSTDITIQFAVWDSGDGIQDSTSIVDNFRFSTSPAMTATVPLP
jgi:hypothetical protein